MDLETRINEASKRFIDSRHDDYLTHHQGADGVDPDRGWAFVRDQFLHLAAARAKAWAATVPPLYHRASLDMLAPEQHPDELRAYLDSAARNLMLAGPVGTGKSFAAWAIAHEFIARDYRAAVWSTPRLMVDMRPEGAPGAFREVCTVPLLVLDDLGAARPTDWAVEQMFSIADERTNYQRFTIITTNQPYENLVALWGQPTMDRFRDQATHLVMGGTSRRGAA